MDSLVLNLAPETRTALEHLLMTAERLEDDARVVDHLPDEPFGDLDEFRRAVYEPLKDKRSAAGGRGEKYSLDLQDAVLVYDVIHGISEGWVGLLR